MEKRLAWSTCHMLRILLAVYQTGSIYLTIHIFFSECSEKIAHKWSNIAEKQIQPRSISKEKKTLTTTTAAKILIRQRSTHSTRVHAKQMWWANVTSTKTVCEQKHIVFCQIIKQTYHFTLKSYANIKWKPQTWWTIPNQTKRNETMRWRWVEQNRTERRSIKKRKHQKHNKLIRWTYLIICTLAHTFWYTISANNMKERNKNHPD